MNENVSEVAKLKAKKSPPAYTGLGRGRPQEGTD